MKRKPTARNRLDKFVNLSLDTNHGRRTHAECSDDASKRNTSSLTRSAIEKTFMKTKPRYVNVNGERIVVLSAKEYERLARKADEWEPPLPEPNERGNYPLEALDIVMAQEMVIARRKLGLTQAELARRAGIRVETLNRIEQGKHSPTLRTMQKIDKALKRAAIAGKA